MEKKLNQDNLLKSIYLVFFSLMFFIGITQASNIPFSDQVDLFYDYFSKDILELFMQQHGPHRQGLGILIMYPILKYFDYNFKYLSYLTILILMINTFLILKISSLFDANILNKIALIVVTLSLGQIELITITPNISHSVLPIMICYLLFYILIIKKNSNIEDYFNILLAGFPLLLFTGFGFIISIVNLFLILISPFLKIKRNLWIYFFNLLLLIIIIIIFFYKYSLSKGEGCLSNGSFINSLTIYLEYVCRVASIPLGGGNLGKLSPIIGLILILSYAIMPIYLILKLSIENYKIYIILTILFLSCLIFSLSVGTGRFCLGLESAYASRYYPFSSLGIVGIILYISKFNNFKLFSKVTITLIIFLNVTLVYPNAFKVSIDFFNRKQAFIECIKTSKISECNEKYVIYPPNSERLENFLKLLNR